MLEPVCRGDNAMLTSRSPGTNPRPPTITRIAPDVESSDTIDASKPWNVSGRTLRACSASDWRLASSVVWMRKPPRKSWLYRS